MADKRYSRRRFFRASLDRLRQGVADAIELQAEASRKLGEAMAEVEGRAAGLDASPTQTSRTVVRPPGALPDEAEFLATCERCRACVDACPEYCIIPSQPGMAAELGTPYLLPEEAPCTFCHECVDACPTGALLPFDKEAVKIGFAVIEPLHCVVSQGAECDLCIQACPKTGAAIYAEEGFPVINTAECTGCGFCGEACPAPARAITIFPTLDRPA